MVKTRIQKKSAPVGISLNNMFCTLADSLLKLGPTSFTLLRSTILNLHSITVHSKRIWLMMLCLPMSTQGPCTQKRPELLILLRHFYILKCNFIMALKISRCKLCLIHFSRIVIFVCIHSYCQF